MDYALERFLDSSKGPVISLASRSVKDWTGKTRWHSMADLRPALCFRHKLSWYKPRGAGWSRDREESRRKALVEAIEGWGYNLYRAERPGAAGMDIDDSANGFAAIPTAMGGEQAMFNGYGEAVERWVLNSIWDDRNVFFREYPLSAALGRFLKRGGAEASCFGLEAAPEKLSAGMPPALSFRICLIKKSCGGVVVGQACAPSARSALGRAVCEAFERALPEPRRAPAPGGAGSGIPSPGMDGRAHFMELSEGYRIVKEQIKIGDPGRHKPPPVIFSRRLPGPWEPEVTVHRVLLDVKGLG